MSNPYSVLPAGDGIVDNDLLYIVDVVVGARGRCSRVVDIEMPWKQRHPVGGNDAQVEVVDEHCRTVVYHVKTGQLV